MTGRRVVITGASSGVGEAASRASVAEGASVALLARRADRLRSIVADLGEDARPIPVEAPFATGSILPVEGGTTVVCLSLEAH